MKHYKELFESKEQYVAFRAAWSKAVNDPDVKHTLTAAHHTLYAILRDRDWCKGFTPVTNQYHLRGNDPYYAAREALQIIRSRGNITESSSDWSKRMAYDFLAPFNGTVTVEMLKAISFDIKTKALSFNEAKEAA